MRRWIKPDQVELIRDLLQQGQSEKTTARLTGLPISLIAKIARGDWKPKPRLTDEKAAQVEELLDSGLSEPEVIRRTGVSNVIVRRIHRGEWKCTVGREAVWYPTRTFKCKCGRTVKQPGHESRTPPSDLCVACQMYRGQDLLDV